MIMRYEETLESYRYVHYLNCANDFTDVNYIKTHQIVPFKHVQSIILQSNLKKAIKIFLV